MTHRKLTLGKNQKLKVTRERAKTNLFDFKPFYIPALSIIALDWQSRGQYLEEPFIHSFIYKYLLSVYNVPGTDVGDMAVNKHNFSVLTQSLQSD